MGRFAVSGDTSDFGTEDTPSIVFFQPAAFFQVGEQVLRLPVMQHFVRSVYLIEHGERQN